MSDVYRLGSAVEFRGDQFTSLDNYGNAASTGVVRESLPPQRQAERLAGFQEIKPASHVRCLYPHHTKEHK